MSQPARIDDYVRPHPRLTYAQADDPWLTRRVIDSIERALGRGKAEAIYASLKERPFESARFFHDVIGSLRLQLRYDAQRLAAVPRRGPLVFVANHPFGLIDGVVLCHLASRTRGDFRILINAVLCQDEDLARHFLPVDFAPGRAAVSNNIRTKKLALAALADQIPVLIFPSGMVSTADRLGFGKVLDAPWTTFAARLIESAQATVVPIHFYGQNSRPFHIASHVAEPLRMAMLIHEALRRAGTAIELEIGTPIPWSELAECGGRQALTDELYRRVQGLGKAG